MAMYVRTYKNVMETPNFEKITISLSQKEALINSNKLLIPLILIKLITGQKPKITKSKKSHVCQKHKTHKNVI